MGCEVHHQGLALTHYIVFIQVKKIEGAILAAVMAGEVSAAEVGPRRCSPQPADYQQAFILA